MARIIGIRHRVKKTADGEARPTMVAIKDGVKVTPYTLETETDELDFVLGRFPTSYRELGEGENVGSFLPHHVQRQKKRGSTEEIIRVPASYDGLRERDVVAMALGGSGDRLAYALSRRGDDIGAKVMRIPPFTLKEWRKESSKDNDHLMLIELAEAGPELFQATGPRDRDLIHLQEAFRARRDAMKDRIACEQRLRQQVIGCIFLSEDGHYPEGLIEDEYDRQKASDVILQALVKEEDQRESELKRAVRSLEIWQKLFAHIEGCGEVIAAGIVSSIGDIRRFATAAKLKAYCGVHVLTDGRLPRKRGGEVANWNSVARQSLFLLGDQFNYRPDSEWGKKFRQYKANMREQHPEVVEEGGKKRFTDGHLHKRARWRALTRFVEMLFREWTRIEAERVEKAAA